jgi:hypothetical protein
VIPTQYECAGRSAPKHTQNAIIHTAKRARLGGEYGVTEKHHSEATTLINQITTQVEIEDQSTLASHLDIESIVALSQDLWRQCMQTKEYNDNPFRYRHRYHVLVVLYSFIKGIKIDYGEKTLIPHNDMIKKWLPPVRQLPRRLKDVDVSTYTKTNKIFLSCMRELYK